MNILQYKRSETILSSYKNLFKFIDYIFESGHVDQNNGLKGIEA